MLRPLNPDQLLALADDDMDAGCMSIYMAKLFFQDQNLSNCVESLLRAFANELSRPVLTIHNYMCKDEKRGADEWSIAFWDRPFTHLSVKPDPKRSGFINIYEEEKHIHTTEILGRPDQGQAFLNWMWQYGDNRLKLQAAIVARRNVCRKHPKSQLPFHTSRVPSSLKDPTHKGSLARYPPPSTTAPQAFQGTSIQEQGREGTK